MMVGNKKRSLSGFISTFGQTVEETQVVLQIVEPPENSRVYRFGSNEYLLFDLDAALQVFDSENKAANLFFTALLKYSERGKKELCFSQPDESAYKSCLNLCASFESNCSLQTAFDGFIKTHTLGVPLGDWVQDLPLWRVRVFEGGKEIEFAVCNSIQSAILTGYYAAKNPDVTHQITRA